MYSLLLGLGYFAALIRRARTVHNGIELQGQLPAMRPLYAQVILSMFLKPRQLAVSRLPAPEMPELSIVSKAVPVNISKLASYRHVCQLSESTHVPLLYPCVETFSMNLACMCLPTFPISVLGSVLARYKAVLYQPILNTDVLTYR